jgi:hypothetical protein
VPQLKHSRAVSTPKALSSSAKSGFTRAIFGLAK